MEQIPIGQKDSEITSSIETKESVPIVASKELILTTYSPIQREAQRYALMAWLIVNVVMEPSQIDLAKKLLPEDSTIFSLRESLFPGWTTSLTNCLQCGEPFQKIKPWQKYCRPRCTAKAWRERRLKV